MQAEQDIHNFIGMQQDLSVSQATSQFLYEAYNMRITAREGDTLLTLTNERGPKEFLEIPHGKFLGHCVLNDYVVVFTHDNTTGYDYIYRIDVPKKVCVELYKGSLGFSLDNPIETLGSYENESIQKVYWTDNINQPRVINIVKENPCYNDDSFDFVQNLQLKEKVTVLKKMDSSGIFAPGTIQYAFTYYNKYGQESNIFYTTPILYVSPKDRGGSPEESVGNAFEITVSNIDSNFEYMRIYSIQRTSTNATPIVKNVIDLNIGSTIESTRHRYFFTPSDNDIPISGDCNVVLSSCKAYDVYKGEISLDSLSLYKTDNTYILYFSKYASLRAVLLPNAYEEEDILWRTDVKFSETDCLELTVVDGVITHYELGKNLKCADAITDYPTVVYSKSDTLTYVDTGTLGSSVDPTALLYIGGEEILADTIAQKDGTMFLGNISINRKQVDDGTEGLRESIQSALSENIVCGSRSAFLQNVSGAPYLYNTSMNATDINKTTTVPTGGFKAREYYRLGVQFQYKNGKWSDPIWICDKQEENLPSYSDLDSTERTLIIPSFYVSTQSDALKTLYAKGYRKARPVVVFPQSYERTVVCQGVANATVYTDKQRSDTKDLYAQSSWFFRPITTLDTKLYDDSKGTCSPTFNGTIPYNQCKFSHTNSAHLTGKTPTRLAEIQGYYDADKQFKVDWNMFTLNSPDFVYDTQSTIFDYEGIYPRIVGYAKVTHTMSTLNLETKTPTIHEDSNGFTKESYITDSSRGIVSGLFYEDYVIDDMANDSDEYTKGDVAPYSKEGAAVKYLVYPWSKEGSINNDMNRPANHGTKTAELLKKCISNFRYARTIWSTPKDLKSILSDVPKMFTSDQMTLLKLKEGTYYGNIDTLLTPDESYSPIFCAGTDSNSKANAYLNAFTLDEGILKAVNPPSLLSENWITLAYGDDEDTSHHGLYKNISGTSNWKFWDSKNIGDYYPALTKCKHPVRMKYKSTPHLVMSVSTSGGLSSMIDSTSGEFRLPIVEMYREYDEDTMFGGTTDDALKSNLWLPCGEPYTMNDGGYITLSFDYGDTWYQRYDCLKTYPFTFEDHNQVVEILSFPVETHCNIDGRYDANRGQMDNLNMSPTIYNLHNDVYSQANNYFNYRIADDDYYKLNAFSNQFTWSTQKNAASEVDNWTDVTLASTYDADGDKGRIEDIKLWNDKLVCFQTNGISIINFNVKNEIPVKEGAPIEITNSYKVDGITYVVTNMGCRNKWDIQIAPLGIYFVDAVSGDLHLLSQEAVNLSQTKNMQMWSSRQNTSRWTPSDYTTQLFYDVVNGDLYYNTDSISLNFCEQTNYFTSFYSYGSVDRMFNVNNSFYAIKDNMMYEMFKGTPNKFFGTYEPYNMTFICNGQKTQNGSEAPSDKIFTNLEFRADLWNDEFEGSLNDNRPFDYMRIWNEYQDSKDTNFLLVDRNAYALVKKFRIWRTQLPRDFTNKRDRIRNPWCKIKLGIHNNDDIANEKLFNIHDMMVTYMI